MKFQDLLIELIKNHNSNENVSLKNIQDIFVRTEATDKSKAYSEGYVSSYRNYYNPYHIGTQSYVDFCKGVEDFKEKLEK